MIQLIFKAHKKTDKIFFHNFFYIYIKMLTDYYQKNKESFQKRLLKGTKIFVKKKKTKSANMLASNIEIFLKKKQKRTSNMVVIDIKVF